ncbi:MAG: CobW family GTP-binding protein [Kofleriaceae bacterium]
MRIPLILVTGFLGAGKTTLLNRLLARRAERDEQGKLGVVVNELGEVGIDGALLGGQTARQIELPGGCVCCVLGEDLDRTLIELVDGNPGLDAIVLETTGVAEPLPIAWAVQREGVAERVRLAAVVTVVDAANFRSQRALSDAVDAQVAYADVVLVTKAELAGEAETRAVEAEIRTLASRALVWIRGTDEHVAWLEQVLVDPPLERAAPPAGPSPREATDPGHVHDDSCRHAEHGAAHGIDSVWVPVSEVVDLEELEDQLADLPSNYVRIKGIFRSVDGRVGVSAPRWVVVHRVGLRVSSEPVAPAEREEGRLVALGPDVKADALAACVDAAVL